MKRSRGQLYRSLCAPTPLPPTRLSDRPQAGDSILHFANWSSDSEYVYFERWGDDIGAMHIRIRDRREEKIGSLKEFRRTIGPERCWSGLTPDNAFLVLRDIGSQEVYALSWDAH